MFFVCLRLTRDPLFSGRHSPTRLHAATGSSTATRTDTYHGHSTSPFQPGYGRARTRATAPWPSTPWATWWEFLRSFGRAATARQLIAILHRCCCCCCCFCCILLLLLRAAVAAVAAGCCRCYCVLLLLLLHAAVAAGCCRCFRCCYCCCCKLLRLLLLLLLQAAAVAACCRCCMLLFLHATATAVIDTAAIRTAARTQASLTLSPQPHPQELSSVRVASTTVAFTMCVLVALPWVCIRGRR